MYKLHEQINKMLGKKSGLSYCDVRERYEHFRSRCTLDIPMTNEIQKLVKRKKNTRKKAGKALEKGCTEPLYEGSKSKCIIKIVPQESSGETFQMDKKCEKKKLVHE